MRSMSRYMAGFMVFLGLFVAARIFIHAAVRDPAGEIQLPPSAMQAKNAAKADSKSHPASLTIPSLSIDAKVQPVGIAYSGAMGVPANFTDVGWYKYGIVPGETGSAVIDGHVDNALGLAGVFKHLQDIKKGDSIYITAQDGTRQRFKVQAVDLYDLADVPTEKIFGQKDGRYLRLITCEGTWVQEKKTYDKRLVVTAILAK